MSDNTTTKTIYCGIERLFLLFLAVYLLKNAEYMTTFNLSPFVPTWTDRFLLISLSTITALKLFFLLISDSQSRRKWLRLMLCAFPIALLWLLVYLNIKYIFLVYLSILTLGCIGTDYRTLLKVQVCVVGAVVLSAALCCMVGAIENRIYWGHGTIRSSFGYTYPTNMAAYYVFIVIAAWVAWDEVWDPVFLLPGLLSLFVSGVIADSKTSLLCSLLFLAAVLWCWLLRNKSETGIMRIQNWFGLLCRISFPLCGIVAIILTVAYHQELPYMDVLNDWTSNRLAQQTDAFYKYGVHLLGNAFEMRGLTSVFPVLNYNYVDCSYLQLLLRCGVLAFLVYMVLWPIMTDAAIKAGKYRLSIGLALIALHSLSEHRFLVADYNLFFIAPFSVLTVHFFPCYDVPSLSPERAKTYKKHIAAILTGGLLILPLLFCWKPILSGGRTLWNVLLSPNLTLQLYQRRSAFLVSIGILYACVFLTFLIYKIVSAILCGEKLKLGYAFGLLLCLIVGSVVLVKANGRLDQAMSEFDDVLEEDKAFVAMAKKIDGMQLYDAELPMLVGRRYGGISTSFYNGEDLARLHNLAVITDSDNQWPSMFQYGFSYAEITDHRAVYTDSPELIQLMEGAGYNPVPYYSKEMTVNMESLAEWNQTTLDSNGSIIISADYPIMNVPDVNLRHGQYRFCFDLSLKHGLADATDLNDEDTCLLLRFTDNSGARQLFEQSVNYGQFDSSGHLELLVTSWFDAAGVEFNLIPEEGVVLELSSVTFRIIA